MQDEKRTSRKRTRWPLWTAVALCALALFALAVGPRLRGRPNILFISIDSLRADRLGAHGYPRGITPQLDAFAGESVVFTQSIAQAPSTEPSHASMFTSLIVSHHGALFCDRARLPEGVRTMAEILKANGYATASWNGGGQVSAEFGFDRGFDRYTSTASDVFDIIVESAAGWIRERRKQPFFLFLHTYEVHHPYTPGPEDLARLEKDYAGPLPAHISKELLMQINNGDVAIDDADRQHIINTYDAEILSMDRAFGRLVALLKEEGLYDNTLIVFTSDHGEEFGEHGMMGWHAHTLYDELVRVPLVMRLPRGRHAGSVVGQQVRSIDILPTMLDLVRIAIPDSCEGTSLLGRVPRDDGEQLMAVSHRDTKRKPSPASLRASGFKLCEGRVYDLRTDPGEQRDVAAELPEIAGILYLQLQGFLTNAPPAITGSRAQLSKDTVTRLRSLGYVR